MFVVGTVLPSICKVGDSRIEYGRGNFQGDRGIVEDTRLKSPVCVGMSQGAEGVVLVPSSVLVEPFKFCQFFAEVTPFLFGLMEALLFSFHVPVPFPAV